MVGPLVQPGAGVGQVFGVVAVEMVLVASAAVLHRAGVGAAPAQEPFGGDAMASAVGFVDALSGQPRHEWCEELAELPLPRIVVSVRPAG
ncbi:hypothetical protein PP1_012590 [Pseudonocardia sp. P1]